MSRVLDAYPDAPDNVREALAEALREVETFTIPPVVLVPFRASRDSAAARLTATFERVRRAKYPFGPRDAKCVTELLAKAEPDAIDAAWAKALAADFPKTATLPELVRNLAHFIGKAPSKGGGDWRSDVGDYAEAWGVAP